jgi:L,D-transpeptidase YcbB
MTDLTFFRWHRKQENRARHHRESRSPALPRRQRGLLRLLILASLLCSPRIIGSSDVMAQTPPVNLSETIVKRLEVRRPPEPEFTPVAKEQIVDPNGSSEVDAVATEETPGAQPNPSQPSANGQAPQSQPTAPAAPTPQVQAQQPTIPQVLAPLPKPAKFIPPKLHVGKEPLRTSAMLTRFYDGRGHQPAWTNNAGVLPHVETFLQLLQTEAEREGLKANDYHSAKIKTLLSAVRSGAEATNPLPPDTLVDLDFLLTDAFLRYGADASLGDVNLEFLNEQWFENNGEEDLVLTLQNALLTNTLEATLKSFPPQQEGYVKLREIFTQYQTITSQGGWPTVPTGISLQFGDRGARVASLRARLQASGDTASASASTTAPVHTASLEQRDTISSSGQEMVFDEETEQAVKNFQRRHSLTANGVVNKETLAALNVSAGIRAQQIARNLERWRRLPKDLGKRHIAVNVPNFMLEVVENDRPVMDMKVVVGKMMRERATPTFSAPMKYVVLNPYWNVPKSIAQKELLPLSRKSPQYLARNNFSVRRIPVGMKQIRDPNAADGSLVSVKTYDYLLRQGPGPKNALGQVKFMFPNDHSVYLHDTPSKSLFNRTVRAFSHGCIRIEKPIDLAEYLLQGTPKGSRKAIQATLKRNKEHTVWLPEPVPVHIQYWTAWVEDDGSLQFRHDIYGYDRLPGTSRLTATTPKARTKSRKKSRPRTQQPDPQMEMQPQPAPPAPPPPAQTEAHTTM